VEWTTPLGLPVDPDVCKDHQHRSQLSFLAYVEDEQGILRRHVLAGTVGGDFSAFLIPPLVPPFGHRDVLASTAENQDMLDQRAGLEGSVDD